MKGLSRLALPAVILVIGALALFGGNTEPPRRVRLSTAHPGPGGARALFLAFEALGADVHRDYEPPGDWPTSRARGQTRVVLAPTRALHASEVERMLAWVRRGGRLVIALPSGFDADARDAANVTKLADLPADWRNRYVPFERALGEGRILAIGRAERLASAVLLGHVQEVDAASMTLETRSLEFEVPWRRGEVVTEVPEPSVDVVAAILAFAEQRPILFDESAHGLGARVHPLRRFGSWLVGTPRGRVVLGLIALGVLALLVRGARRAPPFPPDPLARSGRSSLDHARSLAEAWRRARPGPRPTRLFLAELAERLGAGTDRAAFERRLEIAAARSPQHARDVERVREALAHGAVPPARLPSLARAVERLSSLRLETLADESRLPRADRARTDEKVPLLSAPPTSR